MNDVESTLTGITESLTRQFADVLEPGTVRWYARDSFVALHRTAHADARLPAFAERFAADRLTAHAITTGALPRTTPRVLFVCIHNAGRSQMAAALAAHHARGRLDVHSAGSRPDPAPSATAAAVLAELGVGLDGAFPKPVTDEMLRAADVVVFAGGADTVPRLRGPRYRTWDLPHPPGSDLDGVRAVRDEIDARVRNLLTDLTASSGVTA